VGVTDTGSGLRVSCDNCDCYLEPQDAVVVWRRQISADLVKTTVQVRGCSDCVDDALVKEFQSRPFTLDRALRMLSAARIHARIAECGHCGREMVFIKETKYSTPYSRRAYCSDYCRENSKRANTAWVVCETCKTSFTPTRRDAKTCSPACRQKAYRQRRASGE
jgi:hypothetical protein